VTKGSNSKVSKPISDESEKIDGIKKLETVLNALKRHSSDLVTLGHYSLPISYLEMIKLPLISFALKFGEEFANNLSNGLRDDLVSFIAYFFFD